MRYDVAAKVVIQYGKESMLRRFVGIDPEEVDLLEELPQESVSLRRSDFPLWVKLKGGEERIILVEFQTRWERDVPLRLIEYTARYKLRYRIPVDSVVVLLRRREGLEEEYRDETIRFRYRLVRVWQMRGKDVLGEKEIWLYPFVPVMRSEERDIIAAEEEIYNSQLEREVKADLLTALAIFSGFRGQEMVRELIRRRRDIMIESPAYEIIKEEGIREGLQQGIQQGLQQGIRQMLLETLEVKFETVPLRLMRQINEIQDTEALKMLHRQALKSSSIEEFQEKMRLIIG